MDKTKLRNFALEARLLLEKQIELKIKTFNLEEDVTPEVKGDLFVYKFKNSILSLTESENNNRKVLLSKMSLGIDKIIEKAAYTWFNRLICIRYMEVNGILPLSKDFKYLGFNVLSSIDGSQIPDILKFTNVSNENLDIDINIDEYSKLENDTDKYKYLLLKVCSKMSKVFPNVFGGDTKYIDLLIPDNLLSTNSIINKIVNELDKDDFKEVQIIGWLYQYYNALKKSEAMEKKTKYLKSEIPYVTQLFTPDWIVRYMVENSLLRYYVEHNDSDLYKKVDKNNEPIFKYFVKDNINIGGDRIDPKEIKFLDCCMGSGHILVYAIDVLYEMYLDAGYSKKDIAINILTNNLYGLDIDDRAGQLAILSVLLKLREYDNDIFYKYYSAVFTNNEDVGANQITEGAKLSVPLHIMAMDESNDIPPNVIKYIREKLEKDNSSKELVKLFDYIINITRDAKEIGSALIIDKEIVGANVKTVGANACGALINVINQMDFSDVPVHDKFDFENNKFKIISLIRECIILADKYDVVVTNPPYLPSSKMPSKCKQYIEDYYKDSKTDLFAVFMETKFAKASGYLGMINQHSWMFLSSYENLRKKIISDRNIISMIHLGARAFEDIGGEVVQTTSFILKYNVKDKEKNSEKGTYYRLIDYNDASQKQQKFLEFKDIDITKNEKPQYKFLVDIDKFNNTPGNVVAYWESENVLNAFKEKRLLDFANVITGMTTGDNKKYLKLWYEVDITKIDFNALSKEDLLKKNKIYYPYSKGGERRNWYGNYEYVVNWSFYKDFNRSKTTLKELYFKRGLTWSFVTSGSFSMRVLPNGFLWDVAGSPCFINDDIYYYYILGFLCTNIANKIIKIINPTINVQAIDLQQVPIVISNEKLAIVENLSKECVTLSKSDWDSFETSWDFKKHPLV